MSIEKQNIAYPDTLRTFERNYDAYKLTESLFITPSDLIFTDEEVVDVDYWYSQLGINIFPLHGVNNFAPKDDPTEFITSQQNFDYKKDSGKYKHEFTYDWSLDYHKLINELSGQTLNVIYISGNIIRLKEISETEYSGFSVATIDLEKMLFNSGDSVGNSKLFIEWLDSDELNVYGKDIEVNWNPAKLDRLVLNINLSFSTDTITMYVRYLNNNITGIAASDITITDQNNGNITFGVFVPGNGVYQLGSFSDTITYACLYIQSTLYIGAKRFKFTASVIVVNNMLFADGNNVVFADGNNTVLAKN